MEQAVHPYHEADFNSLLFLVGFQPGFRMRATAGRLPELDRSRLVLSPFYLAFSQATSTVARYYILFTYLRDGLL